MEEVESVEDISQLMLDFSIYGGSVCMLKDFGQ